MNEKPIKGGSVKLILRPKRDGIILNSGTRKREQKFVPKNDSQMAQFYIPLLFVYS